MTRFAAHEIAAFVTGFATGDVPETAIAIARLRVLDTVGLVLGGCDTLASHAAIGVARDNSARPARGASLIGDAASVAPAWAAFAHGVIAHCRDFDDTFSDSVVHPGSTINAVALALAETRAIPTRDVLAAIVIGYEVAARLGSAAGRRLHARGFHATGIHGPIIAACVAARLSGLDATQTVSAIGLAASMSGGLLQFLEDASWSKWLHVGWSAHGGIIAAELAARGFRGPAGALDGENGVFAAFLGRDALQPDALTAGLGRVWRGGEALPKYFPCAHVIQPYIAATLALRAEFGAADIAALDCHIAPWAVPIVCEPQANKRAPTGEMDAIASLFFQVAMAWVDGDVGLEVLTAASHGRIDLLKAAALVSYHVDATLGAGFDGRVVAALRDGRVVTRIVPEPAILPDAIMRKFIMLARRSLSDDRVAVLRDVLTLEQEMWPSEIGAVLRAADTGIRP